MVAQRRRYRCLRSYVRWDDTPVSVPRYEKSFLRGTQIATALANGPVLLPGVLRTLAHHDIPLLMRNPVTIRGCIR